MVVLLLQHTVHGSMGLVLNRPTNARVGRGRDGLPAPVHVSRREERWRDLGPARRWPSTGVAFSHALDSTPSSARAAPCCCALPVDP